MTAVDPRLLPAFAGAWIAGVLSLLAGSWWGFALAALLAVAATAGMATSWRSAFLIAAAAALAVTVSAAVQSATRQAGLPAEGGNVTVVGRVAEDGRATALDSSFPARALVRAEAVLRGDGAVSSAASLVVLGDVEALRRDDHVWVTGRFVPLPPGSATGLLILEGEVRRQPSVGLPGALASARAQFREITDTLSPHGRGLVPGLATGDDSQLPGALAEAMRTSSLTHLTAVSGSHVALAAGAVMFAASRTPRRVRAIVVLLALGLLVGLVGPEASVLRATAMGCVAAVALARGRPPSAIPALAGGGTLLLVLDPWLGLSLGFALSAAATASLLLFAPALVRAWAPRGGKRAVAAALLAVPVAAHLACAPLILSIGGNVSTYGVLANLLVLPAVPPVTICGLLGVATVGWWPGAASVLAHIADVCAGWIAGVAVEASLAPGAVMPWPEGPGGVVVLSVAHLGIGLVLLHVPRLFTAPPWVWIARAVMAGGAACLIVLWPRPQWDVLLCDVGQGHAFLVRTGPGRAAMVDVGPPDGGADACLRSAGVRELDLLVLTHPHADHVGGLDSVLATVPVRRVVVGPTAAPWVDEQLAALSLAAEPMLAGDRGRAGDVPFTVVWPVEGTGQVSQQRGEDAASNDLSLVIAFHTEAGSVLALGDLGAGAQARLAGRLDGVRPALAVVMAHHGSADQDPGLAALLAPTVTLVGVGDNTYGHPTQAALDLYGAHSGSVLRTDQEGDIRILFSSVPVRTPWDA